MAQYYGYTEVYRDMVRQGFDGLHEEKYYMVDNCEKYGYRMLEFSAGATFEQIK